MATTLATIKSTVTGRRKPPVHDQPFQISPNELTELGTIGGKRYWRWKRYELREQPRRYRDQVWMPNPKPGEPDILARAADEMPNGPHTVEMTEDGERVMVAYAMLEAGTYQRLTTSTLPKSLRIVEKRPLDALAGFSILQRRGREAYRPPVAVTGPGAIIEQLARKGYDVTLSTDGDHLVVSGERFGAVRELIDVAGPMLVAWLQERPLTCTVSSHSKKPVEAVTIALGGAAWCLRCKPGDK